LLKIQFYLKLWELLFLKNNHEQLKKLKEEVEFKYIWYFNKMNEFNYKLQNNNFIIFKINVFYMILENRQFVLI